MLQLKAVLWFACLTCFAVILVSCGGSSAPGTIVTGPGKFNHVVIIFQENRTPDNLFQDSVLIGRGADIQNFGYAHDGTKIPLTSTSLQTTFDLGHSHLSFLNACQWNGTQCAMTGSDLVPCVGTCPPTPQFEYVQASDVQPYYTMARTYTFSDRMFQTNQGPSFPAHQYIISGTSATCVPGGTCPGSTTPTTFVADNPSGNVRSDGTVWAGCLAPPNSIVNLVDTSQPFPNHTLSYLTGPECFEHATLTDLLDAKGLSWKYYAPVPGSIWTSPDTIQHICQPTGAADSLVCSGPAWTNANPNVVMEGTAAQVVTDIQGGQLAAVTWVIPAGQASDHANGNQGLGPSWVASIVNAIGQSSFWADTAIIVTWDDWGGWYDHVAPPLHNTGASPNSYEFGFRVPMIFISPYAKSAYVSHQQNDFGSILKFIEQTFSLAQIDPAVGYADSYALGDLSDCYDLTQTPLKFTPVSAPVGANFFINSKERPLPPDTD